MINTSQKKISHLLRSLGLKRNDTVMFHVSSFSFGKIENGIEGFFNVCKKIVGEEGNIIVPTFTYSFRRNKIFDVINTPSYPLIGKFPELVRLKKDSYRSIDPIFSIACYGPQKKDLMKRDNINCFGNDSIYDRLFKKNILIINLGISYTTGCTAFLHLEKLAKVFYREDKYFYGKTIDYNGNLINDKAIHFIRKNEIFKSFVINREKVGRILEEKKISKCIKYGYGKHLSMRFIPFGETVINILKKNPNAMLAKINE